MSDFTRLEDVLKSVGMEQNLNNSKFLGQKIGV